MSKRILKLWSFITKSIRGKRIFKSEKQGYHTAYMELSYCMVHEGSSGAFYLALQSWVASWDFAPSISQPCLIRKAFCLLLSLIKQEMD